MPIKTTLDSSGNEVVQVWAGQPGSPTLAAEFTTTGMGGTSPLPGSFTTITATGAATLVTATASTSVQTPLSIAGNADAATARTGGTVRAPDVSGATTNINGADLTIGGGVGHGNGTPGTVILAAAPAAASGDNPQTRAAVLTIASGTVTVADATNFALNTGTGTKIGTSATQKLGFYNATPIVQPSLVADASGGATQDAEARAAIASVIDALVALGLMAAA